MLDWTQVLGGAVLAGIAVAAASLPWVSDRRLGVGPVPRGGKRERHRLAEWLALYLAVALLTVGFELLVSGRAYLRGWEFYLVTLAAFAVAALPGVVYRYDLRELLAGRRGG